MKIIYVSKKGGKMGVFLLLRHCLVLLDLWFIFIHMQMELLNTSVRYRGCWRDGSFLEKTVLSCVIPYPILYTAVGTVFAYSLKKSMPFPTKVLPMGKKERCWIISSLCLISPTSTAVYILSILGKSNPVHDKKCLKIWVENIKLNLVVKRV